MNRMALALALATLGTGCVVSEPTGGIIFYWTFSSDQYGNIGTFAPGESAAVVCGTAGVDVVGVQLGSDYQEYNCIGGNDVAGIWRQGLSTGRYDYDLYGYRGTDPDPVYHATGVVDVYDGQDTEALVRLSALYWDVVMPVTTPTCYAGDYFSFTVETSSGLTRVYSSGQGPNPAIYVPCATSFDFIVPSLRLGSYRTEWALYDVSDVFAYRSCFVPFTQSGSYSTMTSTIPVDARSCL
ncbi:MAG TPA: hypothetical protein VLS93_13105 [Anaeromyxobacteraceae bacterium]|nr:hypothetical protein [Anaeromyxobacteraceae bacterium]